MSVPENRFLRWYVAWWVLFSLALVPLPLWLFPLSCTAGQMCVLGVSAWGCMVLTYCSLNVAVGVRRLSNAKERSWLSLYDPDAPTAPYHFVVMAGYKEPLELMIRTVDSLQQQTVAHRLIVAVALEEGTPDVQEKQRALLARYEGVFRYFAVTIHPRGWSPGEIPGKCSNVNFATRTIVQQMQSVEKDDALWVDFDRVIVTTCDTDNFFPGKYFEFLGFDFQNCPEPHSVCWQAPLFYNLDLHHRPWFVRCTALLRTFYMLGFLIPQSINTMSVYSFSLQLLISAKYVHPRYQMEDIIFTLRAMLATRQTVPIRMIPLPVISGPTSGATFCQELCEWALQIRRWSAGAAEVFHYYAVKFFRFDRWSGLRYGVVFTHFYGFLWGTVGMFTVTGAVALRLYADQTCVVRPYVQWALVGLLATNYSVFFFIFLLDRWAVSFMNVVEPIPFLRNLLHFVLTLPTIIMYNVVQYGSMFHLVLRGKEACTHIPSKKDGLDIEHLPTKEDPAAPPPPPPSPIVHDEVSSNNRSNVI